MTTLAPQKELTRIRPGYWRNLWRRSDGRVIEDLQPGQTMVDEFHFLSASRYVSAEVAEQRAIRNWSRMSPGGKKLFTWIEARHFKA